MNVLNSHREKSLVTEQIRGPGRERWKYLQPAVNTLTLKTGRNPVAGGGWRLCQAGGWTCDERLGVMWCDVLYCVCTV